MFVSLVLAPVTEWHSTIHYYYIVYLHGEELSVQNTFDVKTSKADMILI